MQDHDMQDHGIAKSVPGSKSAMVEYERTLVMQDAKKIPIEDILEIDGELFGTRENQE